MNNKEQFIEKVMTSIEGINKAEANPFLYEKIVNRMGQDRGKLIPFIQQPQFIRLAACLLVLVAMNVLVCIHFAEPKYTETHTEQQNDVNPVAQEYLSYMKNI
ncbi:MAG: hypothetical protein WCG87_09120 [Bacteroidota bacterium]